MAILTITDKTEVVRTLARRASQIASDIEVSRAFFESDTKFRRFDDQLLGIAGRIITLANQVRDAE